MEITVRGWGRDLGKKEVLTVDLSSQDVVEKIERYSEDKKYIQIIEMGPFRAKRAFIKVLVSGHAALNLNGSYLVEVELWKGEIERLFWLTHGGKELRQLASTLRETSEKLNELWGGS